MQQTSGAVLPIHKIRIAAISTPSNTVNYMEPYRVEKRPILVRRDLSANPRLLEDVHGLHRQRRRKSQVARNLWGNRTGRARTWHPAKTVKRITKEDVRRISTENTTQLVDMLLLTAVRDVVAWWGSSAGGKKGGL